MYMYITRLNLFKSSGLPLKPFFHHGTQFEETKEIRLFMKNEGKNNLFVK